MAVFFPAELFFADAFLVAFFLAVFFAGVFLVACDLAVFFAFLAVFFAAFFLAVFFFPAFVLAVFFFAAFVLAAGDGVDFMVAAVSSDGTGDASDDGVATLDPESAERPGICKAASTNWRNSSITAFMLSDSWLAARPASARKAS